MRRIFVLLVAVVCLASSGRAFANIYGKVRGVVHDPQHRPVGGAAVTLKSATSELTQTAVTNQDGEFVLNTVALGDYVVRVQQPGFDAVEQRVTVASGTAPELHFQLQIGVVQQLATVMAESMPADSATPVSMVNRDDIERTPGASRSNSLSIVTEFVPGAYMTHDMLHMRGGHQLTWQIDGVQIPNTNIASTLGPQIDPKDIDAMETQRGSYSADAGDRTYGIFNVVPRTGFERNRQAELVLNAGNFHQTSAQLSLGDHTERSGYYASLNGNRSDYGLAPPVGQVVHDGANGYGGFASFLHNRTPQDQFRVVTQLRADHYQIPYDPDPQSLENQDFNSSGLRDIEKEADGLAAFTWTHTFNPLTVFQFSPFYHYNSANYEPGRYDFTDEAQASGAVATQAERASHYGGLQSGVSTVIARNSLQAGLYAWGQHDAYVFSVNPQLATGSNGVKGLARLQESAAGGLVEEYVSDSVKATDWLTLIAGVRISQFKGDATESRVAPRFGAALRVPKLNWVVRGFYGRFYQPPPLLTASGPLLVFAQQANTSFAPLQGERDEEHQFGISIPLPGKMGGWTIDADTFKTRANNFLDHSNVGESSIYFPVTIDGALIQAWEVTVRSPRSWSRGQFHLAYSNQIAKSRGAITGGLICSPQGDAAGSGTCATDFSYGPVDHDQRNTLNAGANVSLPWQSYASTNVYYGSGFVNGNPNSLYPGAYLPGHTTFDLSVGKSLGENVAVSLTALNVANRRLLLDNSLTFGGFHFNDPRQIYGEIRYRFHY